ncbi:MAG: hypothetical protein LC798_15385 [Chloroflexi bacterium]|nr:hypothetical protein [Chloroflexota bacterium]
MTTAGETTSQALDQLTADIERAAPLESASVTRPYRTRGDQRAEGWWRVTVGVSGNDLSLAFQPRFASFDDATSFRLAALEVLERAT